MVNVMVSTNHLFYCKIALVCKCVSVKIVLNEYTIFGEKTTSPKSKLDLEYFAQNQLL